jgi:hypothetical protein
MAVPAFIWHHAGTGLPARGKNILSPYTSVLAHPICSCQQTILFIPLFGLKKIALYVIITTLPKVTEYYLKKGRAVAWIFRHF